LYLPFLQELFLAVRLDSSVFKEVFPRMRPFLVLYLVALFSSNVSSFISTSKPSRVTRIFAEPEETLPTPTKDAVKKVAVAGATGQTGRLVVQELLNRDVQVLAMVRSLDKAKETFPDESSDLEILKCDLTSETDIQQALEGCDAVIWCATGFSDSDAGAEPATGIIERLKGLFGISSSPIASRKKIASSPKISIDSVGIPAIANYMLKVNGSQEDFPKVVMLSSAGVTRPQWDGAKKEKFIGCADIPIVRLNPFGILDIKAESEEKLRQTGKFAHRAGNE
jgi:hypothetical protein